MTESDHLPQVYSRRHTWTSYLGREPEPSDSEIERVGGNRPVPVDSSSDMESYHMFGSTVAQAMAAKTTAPQMEFNNNSSTLISLTVRSPN